MRLPVSTAVLLCVIGIAAKAQVAAPAPIPVGTVKAERKQISKTPDFVGRVEAINRVEVRARVRLSGGSSFQRRQYREGGRCALSH
jgi:membrane fusion protein, multidrug efflux system